MDAKAIINKKLAEWNQIRRMSAWQDYLKRKDKLYLDSVNIAINTERPFEGHTLGETHAKLNGELAGMRKMGRLVDMVIKDLEKIKNIKEKK